MIAKTEIDELIHIYLDSVIINSSEILRKVNERYIYITIHKIVPSVY